MKLSYGGPGGDQPVKRAHHGAHWPRALREAPGVERGPFAIKARIQAGRRSRETVPLPMTARMADEQHAHLGTPGASALLKASASKNSGSR
jgi:hypothetical protein